MMACEIYTANLASRVEGNEFKYEVIHIEQEVEAPSDYWDELPTEPIGYREVFEFEVPEEIWQACLLWAMEYDLEPELLAAIAWIETRWKNINSADDKYKGVMQIHLGSHRRRMHRIGVNDLSDVSSNIQVAADYIHELYEEYGDMSIALAKYHGEDGNGEHSYYVNQILQMRDELKVKHGR